MVYMVTSIFQSNSVTIYIILRLVACNVDARVYTYTWYQHHINRHNAKKVFNIIPIVIVIVEIICQVWKCAREHGDISIIYQSVIVAILCVNLSWYSNLPECFGCCGDRIGMLHGANSLLSDLNQFVKFFLLSKHTNRSIWFSFSEYKLKFNNKQGNLERKHAYVSKIFKMENCRSRLNILPEMLWSVPD